jgi:hypothetical protein
MSITAERLRELLHYDPDTGVFTWRSAHSRRVKPGMRAGGLDSRGYIQVRVDGPKRLAHRLAWLYVTGEAPTNHIDHIDLDKTNNAWSNLRMASRRGNSANKRVRADSSSGIKCVQERNGKFRADIGFKGKRIYLGTFVTKEEASAAYFAAAQKFFGEFSRAA